MRIKRWWRRRNIVICLFAAFQFSFSFSFPSRPGVFAPHLAGRQGFLFGEKEAEQKEDGGHSMSSAFSAASCFSFFLKTRLFRCFLPFFFFLKRKGKRRELIFFCFSFSAFKEREKEKRKKSKTSPLFPLLLQAFFFSQKKTYGRKFGMLRGEGKTRKKRRKRK